MNRPARHATKGQPALAGQRWELPVLTKIKTAVHAIFAVIFIVAGAAIGAASGFDQYGWPGAIGYGILGVGVGAIVAISPSLLIQLL